MSEAGKVIGWPHEQTAVMRGLFGNLIYEAERIQKYVFDELGACSACGHLFDKRDPRHYADDVGEWCPACNGEALRAQEAKQKEAAAP